MNRIIVKKEIVPEEDTTLPIVEPLLPNSNRQALTGFVTPPDAIEVQRVSALTGDDIAFLIGRADGVIAAHELSPIIAHKNIYQLPTRSF
jgi:hypothetical protein